MKKLIMVMVAGLIGHAGNAQTHSEKITKQYTFEKAGTNTVMIANMNGGVKVVSHEGPNVIIEVVKTIKAKTNERLEKGKRAVQLGVIDRADTLIFYVQGTCNTFSKVRSKNKGRDRWMRGWNYGWNDCGEECQEEFDYSMEFVVRVPASVNLLVSTINEGNIVVENVEGTVYASNVNGSIKLINLMKATDACTINGDVDITYTKNPDQACRYYSLNGDINAFFQKGLTADLSFESYNGDFYTDIESIVALPVKVEKTDTGGEGTKYKVSGNQYRIRNGGALLDFETFNGDVVLKETAN